MSVRQLWSTHTLLRLALLARLPKSESVAFATRPYLTPFQASAFAATAPMVARARANMASIFMPTPSRR